jgi:hypothetical protein
MALTDTFSERDWFYRQEECVDKIIDALSALWPDGEHQAVCPTCDGTRYIAIPSNDYGGVEPDLCPTCNGNGVISDMQIEGSRGARERTVDCPTCATARPHQVDLQEAM